MSTTDGPVAAATEGIAPAQYAEPRATTAGGGNVVAWHPGGTLPPLPLDLCQCPVCAGSLDFSGNPIVCCNPDCASQPGGFPYVGGRPVLIDFARSVIDRDALLATDGTTVVRRHRRVGVDRRLHMRLYDAMFGTNQSAQNAAVAMLELLHRLPHRPRVLVVGGGTIGGGMQLLYDDPAVDVIAFDVYNSPHVQFIADGHAIPLVDGSLDAVWIQAVLEHVLDPEKVVAEIHRLLRPQGLVYADTPFMQQVHEGPYDFSRFTLSGHRWLFRRFTEIKAGVQGGPGVTLRWSIRYFAAGLFRSYWAGRLIEAAFFWLRYFDAVIPESWASDGACGVWFFGSRADVEMTPRQAIAYYRGAKR
jgi:SAM-dependent methyltransferase